jgi:linoleoyl-CoA desaturase
MQETNKRAFVKFAPNTDGFWPELKKEVDTYFKDNKISPFANTQMYIKSAIMLGLYFIPFFIILSGKFTQQPIIFYSLWVLIGLGMTGIGVAIMHDANHGAYSSNKRVNKLMGGFLDLVGGYSLNWRIQHNVLHHTYTNIEGLDDDINVGAALRLSPHAPFKSMHRFQIIYAWFFYSLMSLFWIVIKDYRLLFRYKKQDLLKKERISFWRAFWEITFFKAFYFFNILIVPIFIFNIPASMIFIGFLIMHLVCGLLLALIFQPAHVLGHMEFPLPDADLKMEHNFAVHQLYNTCNFAPNNKFITWYVGGLNFQVEHHLFPFVCHVHYPKLSPIVKRIAEKYAIPYQQLPSLGSAIAGHANMLYQLGKGYAK